MRYLRRRKNDDVVFGNRGRAILHVAVIWFVLGLATFITPAKPDAIAVEHNHGHTALLIVLLPVWVQATIWLASSLVAVSYCRTAPTSPHDRIAFQALIIPPSIQALSYGWAFFFDLAVNQYAVWLYLAGVILWGFFVSLILVFAGWPEPPTGEHLHEPH